MRLPVFKVAPSVAPADRIEELGRRLFPGEDHVIRERGPRVELSTVSGAIEVDVARGGTWGADLTRLWRWDGEPRSTPDLPKQRTAAAVARRLLADGGMLPEVGRPFRLRPSRVAATTTVLQHEGGARKTIRSDTTVLDEIEVDVSEYLGDGHTVLPLVGGGGRFAAVLGQGGRPIASRATWRPVIGEPTLHEVIPRERADETFRALVGRAPLVDFSASLAYFAAPSFTEQEWLYPVYEYAGILDYDGVRVPMRKVLVPATEVGELPPQPVPQPVRVREARPRVRSLPPDMQLQPGQPLPRGVVVNRRALRDSDLADLLVTPVVGGPLVINPGIPLLKLKELGNLLGAYSAGASWIGVSGGLAGSQGNAQGFVDGLANAGWSIRFNWGDGNAWETDWHRFDDDWVDAVDFVFYTGHANRDGWVLAKPDDEFLHFSETSGAADLWGAKNLEWAIVAACGPLQDDCVSHDGSDVLQRWAGAFDGLHVLMGYAQVTSDTTEEGKRVVAYARNGATIIQSWFRTAQEIQGTGIWAGAYYVGDGATNTGGDHLWGYGSVAPDTVAPTWRACTWVPC